MFFFLNLESIQIISTESNVITTADHTIIFIFRYIVVGRQLKIDSNHIIKSCHPLTKASACMLPVIERVSMCIRIK